MNHTSKIYIAGHRGLVGSAILKNLKEKGYANFVTRTHAELDLTNQEAVANFFETEKPEYVFLAAAKVGGIMANNTYRGEFIYDNLMIQNNIIHQSWKNGVKKLLFLGSTCIYPKQAPQPMPEDSLLTGVLEYTNEPYAIAKIAGIKLCESYNLQYGTNFISVMPTNLYGPNDNFDLEKSHVLPALIRKIHLGKCLEENNWQAIRTDLDKNPIEGINGKASEEAIKTKLDKYGIRHGEDVSIEIWGTGAPLREFLWSEEMADACVYIMEHIDFKAISPSKSTESVSHEIRNTHINIGSGKEISIQGLAKLIKQTLGFQGELIFNASKPDGTMRKLTDVSKLHALGWHHQIEIEEGIRKMYDWYLK
jgi:GDP-L-fucose synthase